jgi:hypothetical protein
VVNCTVDGTKRWRGGPDDKVLMLNSGISTDKAKYSTSIEKNGFILTIALSTIVCLLFYYLLTSNAVYPVGMVNLFPV